MKNMLLLRVIAKLMIPLILLFALYVQFHGEYSPGGGFQAGVIFAAGFILYAFIFELETAQRVAPPGLLQGLMAVGVLLFAGVGIDSLILGGHFLEYNVLLENPVDGQHLGIVLIELGVGITVAATLIIIFYCFAGRDR